MLELKSFYLHHHLCLLRVEWLLLIRLQSLCQVFKAHSKIRSTWKAKKPLVGWCCWVLLWNRFASKISANVSCSLLQSQWSRKSGWDSFLNNDWSSLLREYWNAKISFWWFLCPLHSAIARKDFMKLSLVILRTFSKLLKIQQTLQHWFSVHLGFYLLKMILGTPSARTPSHASFFIFLPV